MKPKTAAIIQAVIAVIVVVAHLAYTAHAVYMLSTGQAELRLADAPIFPAYLL
jgi:hypothetical protein